MFNGRLRKLNLVAWLLAIVVVVIGVVMYAATQRVVFLVFVGLGILTVVNVVIFDNLVLKPQLRAKEQAESDAATSEETPG